MDEEPEIKNSTDKTNIKEFCKLDANNNIVRMKAMLNGKLIKNISVKYDAENRVLEKMFTSELDSDGSYRYVYSYVYY